MFLVLEAVKEKRARIRYVHTSGMLADFAYFANQLLGCAKESTGGR